MFTGLIADVGSVERLDRGSEGARLRIATELASDLAGGDSIAVDGVCLTAAAVDSAGFEADAMNQTLELSTLGELEPGARVNLELAVRASDRLGGHLLQGHVDGTGRVASIREDGLARRLLVELSPELLRYIAERGSVAVNGVSLTVSAVGEELFEVSLIPETMARTTLASLSEGSRVNVEVDQMARYVERLVSPFMERST